MCLSVYVSECLWTKYQTNGWTHLKAAFARWLLTTLARTFLKLVTLGQRLSSQWRKYCFLHNFLLTSLLCFSAFLRSIKMKFGMPLCYALSRLAVDFYNNRTGDDILMTSFIFLSVNKIRAEWNHQFWCSFHLMVAYCTGSNPIEIGDLGSKVKVTET